MNSLTYIHTMYNGAPTRWQVFIVFQVEWDEFLMQFNLMAHDTEYLCIWGKLYIFFAKLSHSLAIYLLGDFVLWCFNCFSLVLYIFWILIPYQMYRWQTFSSHSSTLIFPFVVKELLWFTQSHWSILAVISWAVIILFRKLLPIPISWIVFQ